MNLLQALKNSISFITVIPAGSWDDRIPWSTTLSLFPAVGLLIGLILTLESLLIPKIAPVVCTITWIAITGAFHLDGLADTFDAMASGKDRDERLRIMKDSHIGTFGTAAVVLTISSKMWLIHLNPPYALILAPTLGRLSLIEVARLSQPARPQGLGKLVKENLNRKATTMAHTIALLVSLPFGISGLLAYLLTCIGCRLLSRTFQNLFGGITGDTLGAACELTETVILALLALTL